MENERIIGAFRINIWDECTESDALHGYEGDGYRWGLRIEFKDPEGDVFYDDDLGPGGHQWRTIKHKPLFDGTKTQAWAWAEAYIASLTNCNK